MGMYDYIICEHPIPKIPKKLKDEGFQTKEFDCFLDKYIITKKGELIVQKATLATVPEKKRPGYRKLEWKTPIGKAAGSLKIKYHGDIRFYTCAGSHDEKNFRWYEYNARFTNGKLQWIKRKTQKFS